MIHKDLLLKAAPKKPATSKNVQSEQAIDDQKDLCVYLAISEDDEVHEMTICMSDPPHDSCIFEIEIFEAKDPSM